MASGAPGWALGARAGSRPWFSRSQWEGVDGCPALAPPGSVPAPSWELSLPLSRAPPMALPGRKFIAHPSDEDSEAQRG